MTEKEKSLLSAQKIWADKWKVNNRIVNGSRPHKVLPREQNEQTISTAR